MAPSIAVIGAGFSGLVVGVQARKILNTDNFTIFEKEPAVGGTWLVNKYPGAACDVMSHFYSFSFELNPDWSMSYSPGDEIWRYMDTVAKKHQLHEKTRFGHELREARWIEEDGEWDLLFLVHDNSSKSPTELRLRFNYLIYGGGSLHHPKFPDYPGWDKYKGAAAHSAAWPSGVDLRGKNVGVIGNGASGVQIVEKIAPLAKQLTIYQRTPNWYLPKLMFSYPAWLRWVFRYVPLTMWLHRLYISLSSELMFPIWLKSTWMQSIASFVVHRLYDVTITDSKLRSALTPKYAVGTKRILPQITYLEDLQRPNVELVHAERIVEIDATGIWTEAKQSERKHRDHDIIIAATGFDASPTASPVKIYGRGGVERGDKWFKQTGEKNLAIHYKTVMTSAFPNFFTVYGPNTGVGHTSAVTMIEAEADLSLRIIKEAISHGLKAIEPKEEVERKYTEKLWEDLKKTVWCGGQTHSWYNPTNRTDGKLSTMWPYDAYTMYRQFRDLDLEDFNAIGRDGKAVDTAKLNKAFWVPWVIVIGSAALAGGVAVAMTGHEEVLEWVQQQSEQVVKSVQGVIDSFNH
ncbi:FAD/NAD(P)-binding domain-containing protein [Gonapodya prolifera JEL478]|uniref:FAD/NAD(P)-binding domain-containing protein n=1 Tax=Gonapodya prolifera (strain JEL478) TaxID=1344416 RepID=A0A139ASE6_GONPJ|nr:FAD/NAD(P)-binding domain-containing protein [Gonapodya prolifera JEL478]|eukprot:KXS19666.1 FAD/NAD(P)-binding domain-containing protein [Gonapodya prolifera JEL478]